MIKYLSNSIEDYPEGIVLPTDKPYRWTSADVIRKVKFAAIRHFGKKNLKVGHAGTLDPLATGILLVCLGPATKRAEELQRSAKQYIAGVTFGATTPSYDLEKDIDREFPLDGVSEQSVRELLPRFIGEQDQVAPLFSAKSVDGVRAYETARKLYKAGQLTEENNILQANRINIYDLELLSFASPTAGEFFVSPERPVSTLGHVRGRDPLDTSSEGTQETVGGMERSGRLPGERCYFVVDAIDTLSPKIALIQYCLKNGINLVSSMGSGAKLDATKVRIADISKTKMCPLAHMLRKRLHHLGITTGFLAVYSEEAPRKESTVIEESRNKKSQVGTISYLPTVFGCVCAQATISHIVGIEGNC